MKTFRLASLLAALAMGAGLSAQTISGRLVDEQNQPMPYANVVLLSLPDSAYVTGVVSREDGSFQLKNPTNEERLLRISSVGYVSIYNRCTSGEVGTLRLEPDAATVLNLTQDHLDWHGSMQAYGEAKERIFAQRTVRVLNREDEAVMGMTTPSATVVTFGTDEPSGPGAFGLHVDRGIQWLSVKTPVDETVSGKGRKRAVSSEYVIQHLMPVDDLLIRGQHNASNALAALALCRAIHLPFAPLLQALRDYPGEPHRVETVATVRGVTYIDDSKGTNVGATVAAVEGLGANGTRLVVILGGDGKGQDFSPIAQSMASHARGAVLIGRDAPLIEKALEGAPYPIVHAKDMSEAVKKAAAMAQPHDCVLLSPACASWDMFKNYAERSAIFIESAKALACHDQQ